MKRLFEKGFTLIEIIVIIGILLVISFLTFSSFSNLNSAQALDKDVMEVTSLLNEARSLTLSSKESSQYGVHFETDRIVLFKGSSYSPSESSNIYVDLNRHVLITGINLSLGNEVIFERLTGKALSIGTITLALRAPPATSRTITISSSGIVDASS